MGTTRERIQAKIAEIEEEMRRIGHWQNDPLRPEQYEFRMAFGMDTMGHFLARPRRKRAQC